MTRPGGTVAPNGPLAASRDPESARRALRRVTSGVTVLTINRDGQRHGTTVSAVVTISRDPLILGACLRPSSTFAALMQEAETGMFSVNVLAVEQGPIARHFADPDRPNGDAQFQNVTWGTDELTGAPLIDGCLAHLSCSAVSRERVGDHDLLVAEVIGGRVGPGIPLISFAGRLHHATPDPYDQ
jgi:flavin reductase (DIM6/NTAB) family NADH-FMN oxidoreductase RutF